MFIGVRKSDVRTDRQSLRAETAVVNTKGDAQRTAAGSEQCDLYVTKTVSAPNGSDVPANCNISFLQLKLVPTGLNHDAMKVYKGHGGKTPLILHLVN